MDAATALDAEKRKEKQKAQSKAIEMAAKHKIEKKRFADTMREIEKSREGSKKKEAKLIHLKHTAREATEDAFKKLSASREAKKTAVAAQTALEQARTVTANAAATLQGTEDEAAKAEESLKQAKELEKREVTQAQGQRIIPDE